MLTSHEFHQIVADVFGWPLEKVTENAPVGRSSFDKTKLAAILERRIGRKVPTVHTARTIGELEAQILTLGAGGTAPAPTPAPQIATAASTVTGTLRCGLDIEPVASLPQAADYWEDTFYKATFSPAETAYCVSQQNPRMHFAARWCAKEALRKCDPRFAQTDASLIELASDAGNGIFLRLRNGDNEATRLPHAVSVSHTDNMAAATVVMIG